MTKTFVNKLVAYAKGLKKWEEIVSEGEGYKITADGRLVVIHEEDADRYTARWAIDSITEGLCGLTALEKRIERILHYFYTKVTVEQIKEIAAREEVEETSTEITSYIGKKIYEVANIEEVKNYVENEYGTLDYKIFRNIFNVPAETWIDGISNVCLEVENEIITHQIENI
jgi:hypothetical protein